MTLLAVRVHDDRIELVTDSLAYSAVQFHRCSKVDLFPHIDAAVAGRGVTALVEEWRRYVDGAFQFYADFDDLVQIAEQVLPEMWADLQPAIESSLLGGVRTAEVVQAGWSPTRECFAAFRYMSDDGFVARRIEDFWSGPALAAPQAPASDADWVAVAEAIYETCGIALGTKAPMGGDIFLTRLERGQVSHRRIHRLPDDDWRYRQMCIGSLHRLGQLGPCACGSAKPYARCHLRGVPPTWPCPCNEDGKVFVDCHRVTEAEIDEHLARYPDDFVRTQKALRAAWAATLS